MAARRIERNMVSSPTVVEGLDPLWLEENAETDPLRHAYARWDSAHASAPVRFRSVWEAGRPVGYLLHWLGRPSLPVVHVVGSFGDADWLSRELPEPPAIVVAPQTSAAAVVRAHPGAIRQSVSLMRLDHAPEELGEGRVRPLTPEDAPGLAQLLGRAPDELAWSFPNLDVRDPDVFGAFSQGTLVSVARAAVRLPDIWILTGIYTRPEFRGKGYGSAAVREACLAGVHRSGRVGLYVFDENAAAFRIYQRLGFRVVGQVDWIDLGRSSQA